MTDISWIQFDNGLRRKAPLWAWLMVVAAAMTGCTEVSYAVITHWPKVVTKQVPADVDPYCTLGEDGYYHTAPKTHND